MNTIWTPENEQPLLSAADVTEIRQALSADNASVVISTAINKLHSQHEPLGYALDTFGMQLNEASYEGLWPAKILKTGAAVTLLAYQTAGVFVKVDETALEIGNTLTELYGVPDTYVLAAHRDPNLIQITAALTELPELDDTLPDHSQSGGYAQVLEIGSGFARHYLQQAVELAA